MLVHKPHLAWLGDFNKLKKLSFTYDETTVIHPSEFEYFSELAEITATRVDENQSYCQIFQTLFNELPKHIKIRNFAPEVIEIMEEPNYVGLATNYVTLGKEQKIHFSDAQQAVCGLSFKDKNIVGFEDGSIVVYTYDKESDALRELSTNTSLHRARINQIVETSEKVIIASSVSICIFDYIRSYINSL